ncbi:anti-phage BREX system Lon protease BrxL [Nostoc sp.]|uniref:anti-phage BREX system Lon protease BrxL n=1 Tax=Nostoc sp. TaxID=1180 RepID=UPI002FF68840
MFQDALDQKVNQTFPGKVVRKDLLHQIKGGENVPSYVLEYFLGKYCASDDEDEIRIGIQAVKETLQSNYFRHDEANKAQALVEQRGRHRFIDRIEVRYLASENKYWAAMDHFSYSRIHVADRFYRQYERLLEGGIWGLVDVEFQPTEEEGKRGSFEFYKTSFSYIDQESDAEMTVGVPEQGSAGIISQEPLPPGTVYTATANGEARVGLFRLEVACTSGTGKLQTPTGLDKTLKE